MALSVLTLTNFRNHTLLTLRPQAQFIALYGANGAGKTNILEAVSLLVPGRDYAVPLYRKWQTHLQ